MQETQNLHPTISLNDQHRKSLLKYIHRINFFSYNNKKGYDWNNWTFRDAVERNIQKICVLVKQIPQSEKDRHGSINWAGYDLLSSYFETHEELPVGNEILRDICTVDLSRLKYLIQHIES